MLLTEQAARLQGGDWAPFFAAECAKPYFAALDAFVTEACRPTPLSTRLPRISLLPLPPAPPRASAR